MEDTASIQVSPSAGVAEPAVAQSTSGFTTFDLQGAGTQAQQRPFAKGIDAAADVAGTYADSLGSYHGFLRDDNDTFTIINVTGAATTAGQGTTLTAIDAGGNIAGYFTSPVGQFYGRRGFVRATEHMNWTTARMCIARIRFGGLSPVARRPLFKNL